MNYMENIDNVRQPSSKFDKKYTKKNDIRQIFTLEETPSWENRALPSSEMGYNVEKSQIMGMLCIPNKLAEKRKAAGYSQSQLAKISTVPLRRIQAYEANQRDINKCAVSIALKLADALNCNVRDLLNDEEGE